MVKVKKSIKIAFLISAVIMIVYQLVSNICTVNMITKFSIKSQAIDFIIKNCVNVIPAILFAVFIIALWTADLTGRKIGYEKIFYIILAVLYLPSLFLDLTDFATRIIRNIGTLPFTDMILLFANQLFDFSIVVSILVFFITRIFNIEKLNKFNMIFFAVSLTGYALLFIKSYIFAGNISLYISTVISSFLFLIFKFIAIFGIMLFYYKKEKLILPSSDTQPDNL